MYEYICLLQSRLPRDPLVYSLLIIIIIVIIIIVIIISTTTTTNNNNKKNNLKIMILINIKFYPQNPPVWLVLKQLSPWVLVPSDLDIYFTAITIISIYQTTE